MATNVLLTYGDSAAKEDVVLNAVEILTAQESQIFNLLGKVKAIATVHNYLTDTLRTAASQAVSEGEDYTNLALTTPSRLTNLIEIVAIPFRVSRTQQEIEHYHGQNEKQRQVRKALMDWANAAEFDLVRGTLTSGASGTAPTLSGVIEAISKSTNYTSHTSTTAWDATILDGLMRANWENSNGDVATDLFMGGALRALTDNFTAKSNTVVTGDVRTLVRTVSAFETAFGFVKIHAHRYVYQSGDAHQRVLAIRTDKLKIAFLRKPYIDTGLSRSGDYDSLAVVGKFTLEVHNQNSNWYADGFKAA